MLELRAWLEVRQPSDSRVFPPFNLHVRSGCPSPIHPPRLLLSLRLVLFSSVLHLLRPNLRLPCGPACREIKGVLLLTLVVQKWGTEEVAAWLDLLSLGEYKDTFISHDIRGAELLHLERRDLKDLGITKVGHMKRILQGIKEFSRSPPLAEL
ncbi:hypothetical protein Chor_004536 [Crotalus horridus]